MLDVVTWWWGDKFGLDDVNKLAAGVRRNLKQSYRFTVNHDKGFTEFADSVHDSCTITDKKLTRIPGCFARLRMFSVNWQRWLEITDRIVCIDLDTVITGPLDPLFDRPEPFVIMQGGNASNPCPYNGALMMLQAGAHPEVWSEFSLEAASKAPFHEFPDDQGWIWHKVPNAAGWKTGPETGVYVFRKPGWPEGGDALPEGARLVTFSGKRSPEKFVHVEWVKTHWAA